MRFTATTFGLVAFASGALAHVQLTNPPPLRSQFNPNAAGGPIDFDMVAPLGHNGGNPFPCRGFLSDLGGPTGAPVVQWAAGSPQTIDLTGIAAAHNGGSCQVSLSYDGGATFKVIKSFIGGCVRSLGGLDGNEMSPSQNYAFTVPADAQPGQAVFSWSWFNQSGNREMYQNCAVVEITGSGTSNLSNLPDMFVANVNNGCNTAENVDLEFPNPGAEVERNPAFNGRPTGPPVGTCAAGGGAPPPPPPPPPAGGEVVGGGRSVVVNSGDTCEAIAAANGVTVAQLIANNPAVDANCSNLAIGQNLVLRRRSRVMRSV